MAQPPRVRRRLALGIACAATLGACRAPQLPHRAILSDLQAVSDAYTKAPASRDAKAVVQFFAPDVVVMSPQGRAPVRGLEANLAAWERFFRGANPVHTMTTDTAVVDESGELGYTMGHWTVGVDTPGGRAEAAGEYLAVWRRREGLWRIVALSAYPFR